MFRSVLPVLFVLSACSTAHTPMVDPVLARVDALERRVLELETEVALITASPRDDASTPPCGPDNPYCCDGKVDDCD